MEQGGAQEVNFDDFMLINCQLAVGSYTRGYGHVGAGMVMEADDQDRDVRRAASRTTILSWMIVSVRHENSDDRRRC